MRWLNSGKLEIIAVYVILFVIFFDNLFEKRDVRLILERKQPSKKVCCPAGSLTLKSGRLCAEASVCYVVAKSL